MSSRRNKESIIEKKLDFESEKEEPMKVNLRVRPPDRPRQPSVVKIHEDGKSVKITAPKSSQAYKSGQTEENFQFSNVFGPSCSQESLYKEIAFPMVTNMLEQSGHGIIFSYGVTNSGKTYTIHGTKDQPGIIPRTFETIFNSLKKTKLQSKDKDNCVALDTKDYKFAIVVNYMEIYNENIYDLLQDYSRTKAEPLDIKKDSKDRVGVRGLRDMTVGSFDQAMEVLQMGKANRKVAETKLNADSSRSHSIFTIKFCSVPKEHVVPMEEVQRDPTKHLRYTKLSIIDLAGSERANRTGSKGEQLKEASNINMSLMTFKRCVDALRYNQMHPSRPKQNVPVRESKLTRLFQDYFNGVGKAAMIVNVNPKFDDYDETCRVMKFSAIAQQLKEAVSGIDTGRGPKTDAFDGNTSLIGVESSAKKAPPASTNKRRGAPPSSAIKAPKSTKKAASESTVTNVKAHPDFLSLQNELAESKAQNVRLEAEIRDEVATEFAQEIFRNQLQCEERVMEIREALEEKYERKIQILDELNKTNMQRHAVKYQELVEEYNMLADEYEMKEAELQKKLQALLSKSGGKYSEIIKENEAQISKLNTRIAELESGKQEWKKQVGIMAENRIAQLEKENRELKEENKNLHAAADKRNVKEIFGLRTKKQRSGENLLAAPEMQQQEQDGWVNLQINDKVEKPVKEKGSWRGRGKNQKRSQQATQTNILEVSALDVLKSNTPTKKGKLEHRESDSLRLTEILDIENVSKNNNLKKTSPLLGRRSNAGNVPVIKPNGSRHGSRKGSTRSRF